MVVTRGSFLEDENDAQTVESKSPPSRGEGGTLLMEEMPSSKAKQKRKRLDEARAAPGRKVQREVGSRPDGDVEPRAGQFHAARAGGGAR